MHFLLYLFALTSALHDALADPNYCPPQESSSPCYCAHGLFYGGSGTRVVCSSINDPKTLYNQVQRMRGYNVDYFFLEHSTLPHLPSRLFEGTVVKRIIIQSSKLDRLHELNGQSPFYGLENTLEEIRILFVDEPSKWFWPDTKNLTHLKSIELNMAPIDFVGHSFAEIGGGSLESITVSYSRVYRIHPQAFPELTNMKTAVFSGNQIPYLVRTMFPNPAPKLELLNFRDNKLFTLNENMFENMPALKFLDFTQNEFKTFENNPFKPVWSQLNYFYMSVNPFKCNCDLIPLQQKLLSGSYPQYHDLEQVTCRNPGDKNETHIRELDGNAMHCKP